MSDEATHRTMPGGDGSRDPDARIIRERARLLREENERKEAIRQEQLLRIKRV